MSKDLTKQVKSSDTSGPQPGQLLEKNQIGDQTLTKQGSDMQNTGNISEIKPPEEEKKENTETKPKELVTTESVEEVSVDKLKEQLEQYKTREEDLKKREQAVGEREERLKKDKEVLQKKSSELDRKAKNLEQETKTLFAMQKQMDERYGDVDQKRLDEMLEEMQKNLEEQKDKNQMFDVKQRKKSLHIFEAYVNKVKAKQEKIEKKSNIAGKKGLTRKEEMSLKADIIVAKSNAMKEYIASTASSQEEADKAVMREEARKLLRLRNMYMAFGEFKKAEEMTKNLELMRGSLLQLELGEVEKAMKDTPQVEEDEDEFDLEEKEKLKKIQTEEEDEKKLTDDDRAFIVDRELKEMPEKHAWVRGFQEPERTWLILYGQVNNYDYRKAWIDKQKELKKEFKIPTKKQLEDILDTVIESWKNDHSKFKPTVAQQALLDKNRIPELEKDPLSESMRVVVNGLNDSIYVYITHEAKVQDTSKYTVGVRKNVEEVDTMDGKKGYEYEKQDRKNDCWSVALAALVNYNVTQEDSKVDQKKVRAYKPEFRKIAEGEQQKDLDRAISGITKFTTRNAASNMGNIFALSDYISQQVGDVAVRHMAISAPKCVLDDKRNPGKNAVHNVTEVLKETIKSAVESGQPIAVLKGGHYRVIVEATQNGVTMLNSAGSQAPFDEFITYSELMETGGVLELTWLQTKGLGKLTEEFGGLKRDKTTFSSEKDENLVDPDLVAITKGVVVHKKESEIGEDVSDYISERIYVPKELSKEPPVEEEKAK